jgi:hypothetical protein
LITTVAGTFGLLAATWSGLRAKTLAVAAPVLLLIDLFALGLRYNPLIPEQLDLETRPAALSFLENRARSEPPFRIVAEGNWLPPNLAAIFGLNDIRVLDPASPWRARRFLAIRLTGEPPAGNRPMVVRAGSFDPAAYAYLRIGYRLTRHRRSYRPPLQLAFRGVGGKVWAYRGLLPVFFVPQRVAVEPDPERLWGTLATVDDFASVAYAEEGEPRKQAAGSVTLVAEAANGFDLVTESAQDALAVSSISWLPGWRVLADDGKALTVRRVNGGFLGIEIPAGRTELRVRYRPTGWIVGWWLWGLGVAGVAAHLGISSIRARERAPSSRAVPIMSVDSRATGELVV